MSTPEFTVEDLKYGYTCGPCRAILHSDDMGHIRNFVTEHAKCGKIINKDPAERKYTYFTHVDPCAGAVCSSCGLSIGAHF